MRTLAALCIILTVGTVACDSQSDPTAAQPPSPTVTSPSPSPSPSASPSPTPPAAPFTVEELRQFGVDLAEANFVATLFQLAVLNDTADEPGCDVFSEDILDALSPMQEAPDATIRVHVRSLVSTTRLMAVACASGSSREFTNLYDEFDDTRELVEIRIEELVIDVES